MLHITKTHTHKHSNKHHVKKYAKQNKKHIPSNGIENSLKKMKLNHTIAYKKISEYAHNLFGYFFRMDIIYSILLELNHTIKTYDSFFFLPLR